MKNTKIHKTPKNKIINKFNDDEEQPLLPKLSPISISSKQPYINFFQESEKTKFKTFYSDLFDIPGANSLKKIEEIHDNFLFQDLSKICDVNRLKHLDNAINNYFSDQNKFPFICPIKTFCYDSHSGKITCSLLILNEKLLITGSEDTSIRIWEFDYVQKSLHLNYILWGHSKSILHLKLDKNLKRLFSNSNDKTIRIWDFETKTCIKVLKADKGYLNSICFTVDEKYLLSGYEEKSLIIWDLTEMNIHKQINDLKDAIICIVATPKYLFGCFRTQSLQLWDPTTFQPIREFLMENEFRACSLSVDCDYKSLIVTGEHEELLMYDIDNLTKIFEYKFNKDFDSPTITANFKRIVAIDYSILKVIDISDINNIKTSELQLHEVSKIYHACEMRNVRNFSHDFKKVFIPFQGSPYNAFCYIVDLEDLTCEIFHFPDDSHGNKVEKIILNFTADSKYLFWAEKYAIKIYNLQTNLMEKSISIKQEASHIIIDLISSDDSTLLISGNFDGTISIWDFFQKNLLYEISKNDCNFQIPLVYYRFYDKSKSLFFKCNNNELMRWNIKDNKKAYSIEFPAEFQFNSVFIENCYNFIIVGGNSGVAKYQPYKKTFEIFNTLSLEHMEMQNSNLVTLHRTSVIFWNTASLQKIREIQQEFYSLSQGFLFKFKKTNDNRDCYMYEENQCIGVLRPYIQPYRKPFTIIKVSPNQQFVIGISENSIIDMWDINSIKNFQRKTGWLKETLFIHINSNQKRLISIDMNKILKIWDFSSYELLQEISLSRFNFNERRYTKVTDSLKVINFDYKKIVIIDFSSDTVLSEAIDIEFEYDTNNVISFPSHENKYILIQKNNLMIWDTYKKLKESTYELACSLIKKCCLAPNEEDIIISDEKNEIIYFNLNNHKQNDVKIQTGYLEGLIIIKIEFTTDSMKFIIQTKEKDRESISIWGVKEKCLLHTIENLNNITSFLMTPEDKLLYSCRDQKLYMVDLKNLQKNSSLLVKTLNSSIFVMIYDYESDTIVLVDDDRVLVFLDLKTLEIKKEIIEYDDEINKYTPNSLKISPDYKKIIAISQNSAKLLIFDINTKKEISHYSISYGGAFTITDDTTNSQLIFMQSDKTTMVICDLDSMKITKETIINEEKYKILYNYDSMQVYKQKVIFGCSDGYIRIWDMTLKTKIETLNLDVSHIGNALLIKELDSLVVGIDSGNIMQDILEYDVISLKDYKSIMKMKANKQFTSILYSKQKGKLFIGECNDNKTKIYKYDVKNNFLCVNFVMHKDCEKIISINEVPDETIKKLIIIDFKGIVFIVDFNLEITCCQISINCVNLFHFSFPKNCDNLAINGFNVLDMKNDYIVEEIKNDKIITDFCLDGENNLIYSDNTGLHSSKIRFFLNVYQDFASLKDLFNECENFEEIVNKNKLMLPFKFNALHILAITGSLDIYKKNKVTWLSFEKLNIKLNCFLALDFMDQTCLDILIKQGNKTLLGNFIKKIVKIIEENEFDKVTFYQKIKFFSYDFNYNHQTLSNMISTIVDFYGEDTEILNKIFNLSFITLDSEYFYDNLMINELKEPIYFINNTLGWLLDPIMIKEEINKRLPWSKINKKDTNQVLVKCKILFLKGITEINSDNQKVWESILGLDTSNKFFANKTLEILINYKWNSYAKQFFFMEFFFFFLFFLLFTINFIYLFPNRLSNDSDNKSYIIVSMVFDILDLCYFLIYFFNEIKQIKFIGLKYFTEFWNYIDLFVVGCTLASLILDIIYMCKSNDNFPLKIIVAITFLLLWMRILSYSRGFQGTSFLIQLVQQTIIDIRYFLLIIFLILLGFGSAAFMLQNEFEHSPFYVFNLVYRLILGDYTNYDNYDQELDTPIILWIGMILFTVLLSIIMLNLLISIIGNTFAMVLATEKSMRNIELLTAINEIEKSKIPNFKIRELKRNNLVGDYLICFYHDSHFLDEEFIKNQMEEQNRQNLKEIEINQKSILNRLGIMENNQKKIEENQNKIDQEIKKTIGDNMKKIEDTIINYLKKSEKI